MKTWRIIEQATTAQSLYKITDACGLLSMPLEATHSQSNDVLLVTIAFYLLLLRCVYIYVIRKLSAYTARLVQSVMQEVLNLKVMGLSPTSNMTIFLCRFYCHCCSDVVITIFTICLHHPIKVFTYKLCLDNNFMSHLIILSQVILQRYRRVDTLTG